MSKQVPTSTPRAVVLDTPMLLHAMWEDNNLGLELVRLLVEAGADVNATGGSSGHPMLHHAMFQDDNNVELVRLLVGTGADVNARNGNGISMLKVAISTGNLDIIQILVDAGAQE